MDKDREIDIDLGKIFFMMRKRIIYVILATLILAVAAGCTTEFFIEPKYSTSCTMYVYSNTDRISSDSSIGSNELSASQQLVKTYIIVLESDNVLESVKEELGLNISTSALRGMISCSQVNETEVFRVTVTSTNPTTAANVANAIAQVAPAEIVRVVKAGGVEVIDYAKVPTSPSSPNLKKNILIGAMIGFLVSFVGFFVYELFDTTVTSEKDIEREFDIPILGTIPRLIPMSDHDDENAAGSDSKKAVSKTSKGGK